MNPWLKGALITLAILGVSVGAQYGLPVIIPDTAWRQLLLDTLVKVVVALSLNVVNGMAGQFSIGHAGFVGIGAYTAAITASHLQQSMHPGISIANIPLESSFVVVPAAMIAAAIAAGAFGLLVGLPSLRLKGDYLALVTLGFAEIIRQVISGTSAAISPLIAQLGGVNGYLGADGHGVPQYAGPFWIVGVALWAIVIAWRLKFSGWGRALRALREDEIAAAAVGVDPTRYKVTSFVIAAMGGGVAGSLLALVYDGSPSVQPASYSVVASFEAITMVILGGSGSISGAVLGAIFVTLSVRLIEQVQGIDSVRDFVRAHPNFDLNALRMVLYAATLIGLMILRPAGVFGERELSLARFFPKKAKAASPAKEKG
ncbi:MAG: branched-chain amino acid ABC transporter permease [Polyangiaceae bacterium]